MRVRSAPLRPGASPMNIRRALSGPFKLLSTAARSHIAGQRMQAAASVMSFANCAFLSGNGYLTRGDIVSAVLHRVLIGAQQFQPHSMFAGRPALEPDRLPLVDVSGIVAPSNSNEINILRM